MAYKYLKVIHRRKSHVPLQTLVQPDENWVPGNPQPMLTSKPHQEPLYHALEGKVSELHQIGNARESRWSVFATLEASKDGHRVEMQL